MRAAGPDLLAGDHPFVAVALGLGGQTGQVAAGTGLAEQLTTDDVAAVHLAHVQIASGVRTVRENGGSDHPETDGEATLIRDVELGLQRVVGALVRGRQRASTVGLGAGDVSEAGVELLASPGARQIDVDLFLVAFLFLEHGDLVGALAPHELLLGLLAGSVGFEEGQGLGLELFESGLRHGRPPVSETGEPYPTSSA